MVDYSARSDIFLAMKGSESNGVIKMSELKIPAYESTRRNVIPGNRLCETKFGGVMEKTHCTIYSVLSEICIVVTD